MNQEGGIEPEQFRIEAMIDRMDAVGRAWLGLTIACAQCHNHKYDPISQKEYFQFFAFLNNDDEPFIEVPTAAEQKKRDEIRARSAQLEDKAMRETTNLTERLAAWEKRCGRRRRRHGPCSTRRNGINFATKYEKQSDALAAGRRRYQTRRRHARLGGHDAHEHHRLSPRSR